MIMSMKRFMRKWVLIENQMIQRWKSLIQKGKTNSKNSLQENSQSKESANNNTSKNQHNINKQHQKSIKTKQKLISYLNLEQINPKSKEVPLNYQD